MHFSIAIPRIPRGSVVSNVSMPSTAKGLCRSAACPHPEHFLCWFLSSGHDLMTVWTLIAGEELTAYFGENKVLKPISVSGLDQLATLADLEHPGQ